MRYLMDYGFISIVTIMLCSGCSNCCQIDNFVEYDSPINGEYDCIMDDESYEAHCK